MQTDNATPNVIEHKNPRAVYRRKREILLHGLFASDPSKQPSSSDQLENAKQALCQALGMQKNTFSDSNDLDMLYQQHGQDIVHAVVNFLSDAPVHVTGKDFTLFKNLMLNFKKSTGSDAELNPTCMFKLLKRTNDSFKSWITYLLSDHDSFIDGCETLFSHASFDQELARRILNIKTLRKKKTGSKVIAPKLVLWCKKHNKQSAFETVAKKAGYSQTWCDQLWHAESELVDAKWLNLLADKNEPNSLAGSETANDSFQRELEQWMSNNIAPNRQGLKEEPKISALLDKLETTAPTKYQPLHGHLAIDNYLAYLYCNRKALVIEAFCTTVIPQTGAEQGDGNRDKQYEYQWSKACALLIQQYRAAGIEFKCPAISAIKTRLKNASRGTTEHVSTELKTTLELCSLIDPKGDTIDLAFALLKDKVIKRIMAATTINAGNGSTGLVLLDWCKNNPKHGVRVLSIMLKKLKLIDLNCDARYQEWFDKTTKTVDTPVTPAASTLQDISMPQNESAQTNDAMSQNKLKSSENLAPQDEPEQPKDAIPQNGAISQDESAQPKNGAIPQEDVASLASAPNPPPHSQTPTDLPDNEEDKSVSTDPLPESELLIHKAEAKSESLGDDAPHKQESKSKSQDDTTSRAREPKLPGDNESSYQESDALSRVEERMRELFASDQLKNMPTTRSEDIAHGKNLTEWVTLQRDSNTSSHYAVELFAAIRRGEQPITSSGDMLRGKIAQADRNWRFRGIVYGAMRELYNAELEYQKRAEGPQTEQADKIEAAAELAKAAHNQQATNEAGQAQTNTYLIAQTGAAAVIKAEQGLDNLSEWPNDPSTIKRHDKDVLLDACRSHIATELERIAQLPSNQDPADQLHKFANFCQWLSSMNNDDLACTQLENSENQSKNYKFDPHLLQTHAKLAVTVSALNVHRHTNWFSRRRWTMETRTGKKFRAISEQLQHLAQKVQNLKGNPKEVSDQLAQMRAKLCREVTYRKLDETKAHLHDLSPKQTVEDRPPFLMSCH